MRHESIYALYSNVTSVSGEGTTAIAFDKNGNKVTYDQTNVAKKEKELLNAEPMRILRNKRNSLLADTDWWASSDLTITDAQKKYRQDLRDITKNATSLDDVTWPEKP